MYRKGMLLGLMFANLLLVGCYSALVLGGEAIRASYKNIDLVESQGFSLTELKGVVLGVHVPPSSFQGMGFPFTVSPGLYGDMISSEIEKKGFDVRNIDEISDLNDLATLNKLADNGITILMHCRLSLEHSTSVMSSITGGEAFNMGVKEFVIRGIDTKSGKTVFRMTGRYGKTKRASDMAVDVAQVLEEKTSSSGKQRP